MVLADWIISNCAIVVLFKIKIIVNIFYIFVHKVMRSSKYKNQHCGMNAIFILFLVQPV
jgi:hypothetical protein